MCHSGDFLDSIQNSTLMQQLYRDSSGSLKLWWGLKNDLALKALSIFTSKKDAPLDRCTSNKDLRD